MPFAADKISNIRALRVALDRSPEGEATRASPEKIRHYPQRRLLKELELDAAARRSLSPERGYDLRMGSEASDDRPTRIDYEVDDLVRVLRDYGVLTRGDLRERSGARDWSDNSFAAVLGRAVAEGSIKDLGDGLFELGPQARDPSETRYDPP